MRYNFDEIVPRTGTNSYKWDSAVGTDVLPMWVADMDFRTAPVIIEALRQRVEHGIFGYTQVPDAYYEAVTGWFERRHGWQIRKEWMIYTSGVVPAISAVIKVLTEPGDKVLVQTPVYNCFFSSIRNNGCEIIRNPLSYAHDTFTIDYEDLERKAADPRVKVMLLCNPHNPGGRVWTADELREIAAICYDSGTFVISDEIHADLTLPPYKHHPFATVSEKAAANSLVFMAPSKAFNMPGLGSSYAITVDKGIRERFQTFMEAGEFSEGHLLAYIGAAAAYMHGAEWLEQMLDYIKGNIDFTENYLEEYIPGISMIRPQASYLVFLDCRALGLTQEALTRLFAEKAHLALNDGTMFGVPGEGFMRLNIGCPHSVLEQALKQLRDAVVQ